MSAKDNFAQAMKELLNGEVEATVEKEEKKPATSSSFSSFSQPEPKPLLRKEEQERENDVQNISEPAEQARFVAQPESPATPPVAEKATFPVPAAVPAPAPAPAPVREYQTNHSIFASAATTFSNAPAPAAAPSGVAVSASSAPSSAAMNTLPAGVGETTVIAPGTTLVGDMTTAGGLRVGGNIKGNLKVASMMELNGKVIGDIEASDAIIIGSTVRGNVSVTNVLTMDGETTIVGDVSAKSVDVNGKIKGNLTVEERGHFQSNAVLVGNLISGTVIIDEGAMLKGDISITSSQTENLTVDEPDFDIE